MNYEMMICYLEQIYKQKPRFTIYYQQMDDVFIVTCSHTIGRGKTIKAAVLDYKDQRDKLIDELKQYASKDI